MVRPLRVECEDAYYHVMNRGRGRQYIFNGSRFYQLFLEGCAQAYQRFGLEIHAYCLNKDSYHMLVKTPRGNLSRAMRHINGVYTQRYNELKKSDGSLFRGRYKSTLIEADTQLLKVSRYIHQLPLLQKKPAVNHLIDYTWSSYPAFLNKASKPAWLVTDNIKEALVVRHPVPAYKRYIERGLDEETEFFYAKNIWPAIRGSEDFVKMIKENVKAYGKKTKKPRDKNLVTIKTIVSTVAKYFGCTNKTITIVKRGRTNKNIARWLAMKLSQDLSGETLQAIAAHFNVNSYSSVSRTISQLTLEMKENSEVMQNYDSLCSALSTG